MCNHQCLLFKKQIKGRKISSNFFLGVFETPSFPPRGNFGHSISSLISESMFQFLSQLQVSHKSEVRSNFHPRQNIRTFFTTLSQTNSAFFISMQSTLKITEITFRPMANSNILSDSTQRWIGFDLLSNTQIHKLGVVVSRF